jgi:N-acetylneuraminic acid mutarotase
LVDTLCEKYDPATDKWEKIEIAGSPCLAAFAWCSIDKAQIMVLGGTDGDLLQEGTWVIDFEKREA